MGRGGGGGGGGECAFGLQGGRGLCLRGVVGVRSEGREVIINIFSLQVKRCNRFSVMRL